MTVIYDQFISTKIGEFLSSEEKGHDRTSFWATDSEKPLFDLYHSWIGTPVTNPIEPDKHVMFIAARMMESSLIETLTKMGLIIDSQKRIAVTREGVPITGYIDGVFSDGTPLEVKTLYGNYQVADLKAGKPKVSYLKQLAIYMDALDKNMGKLICMERGTGEMFEFTLLREGTKFKCLTQEFDLIDTYKRWAKLYKENIEPKIEPDIFEFRYKYDVDKIEWSKISRSQIYSARSGKAVLGDWQVKYSPYKNLWIEKQQARLGYSEIEIEKIKLATKGYTSLTKK